MISMNFNSYTSLVIFFIILVLFCFVFDHETSLTIRVLRVDFLLFSFLEPLIVFKSGIKANISSVKCRNEDSPNTVFESTFSVKSPAKTLSVSRMQPLHNHTWYRPTSRILFEYVNVSGKIKLITS